MPIYEYECEKCHHRFELLKSKMMTDSKEKCPACGATARQQLSAFGVGSSGHTCDAGCRHGASPCQMGGSCGDGGGCPFSGM
ncbi:MAG: zinc ribbon domain-containing protein [Phycisphaerae bacterium]|jgi:putative FmdB family regulatory protein|nr:zinc ribbon domain-containing protein [Phycisphaerae bacterium]